MSNATAPSKLEVVILHGYAETPERFWLPWLHRKLEDRGVSVWVPALPDSLKPNLNRWLRVTAARAAMWGPNTVVVCHSLGGALCLRLLETAVRRQVRAVVLVGTPFAATVGFGWLAEFFAQRIDWLKISRRAAKFVIIQSKNDPLVPYDHSFRHWERLGGRHILTEKDGHFVGRTAPLVLQEVLKILKGR